jgi:hypothetical protein
MASEARHVEIEELSDEEGRRLFDRAARRYLNMSGEEFLRRWDAGELDEDDRPEVTTVAMLIPFAR